MSTEEGTDDVLDVSSLFDASGNGDGKQTTADGDAGNKQTIEQTAATTSAQSTQHAETAGTQQGGTVEGSKPRGDVRGALRAARVAERRAKEEADRLRRENADLKAGKKPDTEQSAMSEEDLSAIEADFPAVGTVVRKLTEQVKQLTTAQPKESTTAADPEFIPDTLPPQLQDAVDDVPDLLAWQNDPDQARWTLAKSTDILLCNHPAWKDKPVAERLAETARRVNAEFTQASQQQTTTPAPQRADPKAVISNAKRVRPGTLSDIGGGEGEGVTEILTRAQMERMSDDELLSAVRMGLLS